MTNLIPQTAQKQVRREYWFRTLSVWSIITGAATLMLVILTIPVYVLVTIQLSDQTEIETQSSTERNQLQEIEKILQSAGEYAALVLAEVSEQTLTDHISNIVSLSNNAISIDTYRLEKVKKTQNEEVTVMSIQGVATTRMALANFRDALENNDLYEEVTLPIATLIKDRDVDFSMQLTVANKKP